MRSFIVVSTNAKFDPECIFKLLVNYQRVLEQHSLLQYSSKQLYRAQHSCHSFTPFMSHDKSASKILVNLFLTIAVTRQGSRQRWQRRVCSVGGRFLASSAGDDGALGGDSIDILGMSLNLSLTMFGVMRHISTFTEAVPRLACYLHP